MVTRPFVGDGRRRPRRSRARPNRRRSGRATSSLLSGQIALKPCDKELSGGTIEEQTEQVFANLSGHHRRGCKDSKGGGM